MDANRKARSAERPPSPKAPMGARFRRRRARAATGAAVISLALATALGPAAADELLADDAPSTAASGAAAVTWVMVDAPSTAADLNLARVPKEPTQLEKETLVLTLIKQQRDAEAVFARLAAHDAAETAHQEAAAEAARQREAEQQAPSAGPSAPAGGVWDSLASCESGGNWSIKTGNGYYGGLQFSASTWRAHGGSGMPHENSRGAQIAIAQRVQASQGWGAWPSCSSKLGLR